MPLESLSNEQINIHDLTLEQEKQPVPEWQEQYEKLKETGLYDYDLSQWNAFLDEDQSLSDTRRYSEDQLLGVLCESFFDIQSAQSQYKLLKETRLLDKRNSRNSQWIVNLDKDQYPSNNDRDAHGQLCGILCEAIFDKQSSFEKFKALKLTNLYDRNLEQWNFSINWEQDIDIDQRVADVQLIGILCEAIFDKQEAFKKYQVLKQTPLYDSQLNMWNPAMSSQQESYESRSNENDVASQLTGILAEALFDKQTALERYRALKKTNLYDDEHKQWVWMADKNNTVINSGRRTSIQLLGIMCEHEFEEPNLEQPSAPQLPETRSY